MFNAISINESNKMKRTTQTKICFQNYKRPCNATLVLLASSSANESDATTVLLDSTAANVNQATVPAPTLASSTLREGADNRDSASSAEEVNQGEHFLTT